MRTVGVICEGPTDLAVLERLLEGALGVGVVANPIQPPIPMRAGIDFGGWEQVFGSIRRKDVSGAQAFDNELVIIQVDTDVCELPRFDVSRRADGRPRTEAELVAAVRARLVAEITAADPEADLARVVLAVCVDSLECWLLLVLDPRKTKTTGCMAAANQALRKAGRRPLDNGAGVKDVRAYEDAARDLRRPRTVEPLHGRSASLDLFLAELRQKTSSS